MFRLRTHRLMIALLAQILLCLVAAPVIGAQQCVIPSEIPPGPPPDHREKPPAESDVMRAAFDASNVRPEEECGTGQKKKHGGPSACTSIGTPGGLRGDLLNDTAFDAAAWLQCILHEIPAGSEGREETAPPSAPIAIEATPPCKTWAGRPCRVGHVLTPAIFFKPLCETAPAIQPTGPPAVR